MRTGRAKRILLTAGAYLVAALFLLPYLQMFLTSVKPSRELFATPPRYLPEGWQWANFIEVWNFGDLALNFRNSLLISVASTAVALAVSLPAAYYTARHRFHGRTAFLLLVLITQMFAPTALVIGLYREFVSLGLVNTFAALILTNAAFNLPFCTWILNAYFSSIPAELEEAAWLDGCGRLKTLLRITLPLSLPGVLTATIFTFIQTWNEFVVALTLSSTPDRQPLTVGITTFIGQYQVQWQYLFAISLFAIIPVVVLFIAIERHLIGGLTTGSIR
jgi:multiple sugar transport system permease protein